MNKNNKMITCYNMGQPSNEFEPYTQNGGVSPTLLSRMGTGGNQIPIVHCYDTQRRSDVCREVKGNISPTLLGMCGTGGGNVPMIQEIYSMGHDERSAQFTPNKTDPLVASDYKQPPIIAEPKCVGNGQLHQIQLSDKAGALNCMHDQQAVMTNKTVRRLTCLEAERLMGLPDYWTDVEINGKPAPDSKRYKAIGNGMAVPCSDFILKRIVEVADNGKS